MKCRICNLNVNEIQEYVDEAKINECTPEEFAEMDGTYDKHTVICTNCYIKIGMPIWK